MQDKIQKYKQELIDKLKQTELFEEIEQLETEYLGRKGKLTQIFKQVKDVAEEQKPIIGKFINQAKQEIENAIVEVKNQIENNKDTESSSIFFDSSQPGKKPKVGSMHPLTLVKEELNDAFKFLGFEIFEGPEITTEKYAFDNLNFPPDHPARESMDTYWLEKNEALDKKTKKEQKICLRPHLTGASVRYMQTHKPPFRFVYPGRVFRSEATDARHERCFYQYEALIVNKDISFSGGKILVKTILKRVFGREVKVRMRAGFFPFVEPGFEIDMQCLNCSGKGCKVCGHSGWIEMMPGGPPHPNVLKAGGIDPKEWQGFYINIGLDRIAMMKYGINDIRLMHSGDIRFLTQFNF